MKTISPFCALVLAIMFFTSGPRAQTQNDNRDRELAEANDLTSKLINLYSAKRYKEALPLAQKTVEIRRRLLSSNDASLASAYTNLGEVYFELQKDSEAEEAFTQALGIYEARGETTARAISQTLDRLAYLRFRKTDYENADRLYIRSLELKEKDLGASNPETVAAMKNFACLNLIARGNNHKNPEDTDGSRHALRSRAVCWLNGFNDDCATADFNFRPDQGVVNGKAVRLVQPPYPADARAQRHAGNVFISIRINEKGNVVDAKPVCGGYPELNKAGLEAARASKFTPTVLNGMPVQVTGTIIYRFVLQR
jgi:TonB family protein